MTEILIDDYTNAPIDGAKIKVKGINAGAFIDANGAFKITLQGELPIILISSFWVMQILKPLSPQSLHRSISD